MPNFVRTSAAWSSTAVSGAEWSAWIVIGPSFSSHYVLPVCSLAKFRIQLSAESWKPLPKLGILKDELQL
ncbi:hypothetical protein GCM10010052_07100 [Paenarthrobacter histidinolovorans]|nr:hypothetical protein GCM10010052_07100 [Paenarthrobacter histidinolovorans]